MFTLTATANVAVACAVNHFIVMNAEICQRPARVAILNLIIAISINHHLCDNGTFMEVRYAIRKANP